MYVILTNYVNWHRVNLRLYREITGNLKTQFEWVPCTIVTQRVAGAVIELPFHVFTLHKPLGC